MKELMVIEIYKNGDWIKSDFQDIVIGSKFKMRNPKTSKLFIGESDKTEFISTSVPYLNKEEIWTVNIK